MWENKVTNKDIQNNQKPKTKEAKVDKPKREKRTRFVMPPKIKKIIIAFCMVLAVLCLVAGILAGFNFKKLNIDGFDGELRDIPSASQALAQQEIDKIIYLNTGNQNTDVRFVVRDKKEGEYVYRVDNETKQGYASFYIDSDELQLSLRVQMQWAIGMFAENINGTPARVSCAEAGHSKYQEVTCIDVISDEYLLEAKVLDNFHLLASKENGQLGVTNLSTLRSVLPSYLKNAEGKLESILLLPRTISAVGNNISAIIKTNTGRQYQLILENTDKEITIILKSGDNELLRYDSSKLKTATRHFLLLKNYLPAEIELEDDTAIALRFAGGKKINANVENCELEKDTDTVKKYINNWISSQDFEPNDFEINIIKHCEK